MIKSDRGVEIRTIIKISTEHADRYEAQRIADREAAMRLAHPVVEHVSLTEFKSVWTVRATYTEGDLK